MNRIASLKAHRFILLLIFLPFIFTADARMLTNHPPVAVNDNYTRHRSGNIGPMLANDSDPDGDSLSLNILTYPTHGRLYGTYIADVKDYELNDTSYVGTDSFTYQACDPQGACSNTATVTINVVNNAPVAVPDTYIARGSTNIGPFMANDYDPDGDAISIYGDLVSYPTHGTIYGLAYPTFPYDMKNYVPQTGFTGADFFSYKISDSLNVFSSPATVILFVLKNDGAENAGCPCNGEIAPQAVARPVNVSNGNMYLHQTDYQLPGAGEAINTTRMYNSILQSVGLF